MNIDGETMITKLKLPVEEFTTPDPITAQANANIHELSELMKNHNVRHLPILRNSRVVGIVSDRDIRVVSCLTPNQKILVQAHDIMSADPLTVCTRDSLDDVAFKMSLKKVGSVIVNDESDQFYGIFTATDALNALIEIMRGENQIQL